MALSSVVVLVALYLFLHFSDIVKADSFFNTTVGPYGICGTDHLNVETVLSECYSRCIKPPQPNGGYTVTIHQSDVKNAGPTVVECRKVTLEQIFTKTWLFSTTRTEPLITSELASEGECKETIMKNCPSYDCNIREPHSLDEEYHYASDTTVRKTFITAISMPSSLTTNGINMQIIPLGSAEPFNVEAEKGVSGEAMYLWKEKTYDDVCPFTPAAKYGCDYYANVDSDKHFVCAKGGFSLSNGFWLEKIFSNCKHIMMSKEGVLFSFDKGDGAQVFSQRLDLTDVQYKQEDTESFRNKMNHVLSNMDSDMCMMQCEMLSLEARLKRDTPKMLKIGKSMILLEPNGTGIGCKTAYGCRLSTPHVFCGSPPRIGIECTGQSGYWNPVSPYVMAGGVCQRPKSNETLYMSAGHHTYSVDDDLTILAPSGFLHGRQADLFSRDHMDGLQFSRKDISDLRASWMAAKNDNTKIASETDSNRNITAPNFETKLFELPDKLAHYLAQKTHEVVVFLTVICVIIVSVWAGGKFIIGPMLKAPKRRDEVMLQERRQEYQPVAKWI